MIFTTASGKPVPVRRARDLASAAQTGGRAFSWSLPSLSGRLCELATEPGSPWLTLLCRLILDAGSAGEPAAWVTASRDTFYPPDFQANGVDLNCLPVVFAPDARRASRAAEHLLRSGAFSLVILQIDGQRLSNAILGRLASLADQYNAGLLIVTSAPVRRLRAPAAYDTLGSLISLRMNCRVRQEPARSPYRSNESVYHARHGTFIRSPQGTFLCELTVTKDKRNGPGRVYREICNGIAGLC